VLSGRRQERASATPKGVQKKGLLEGSWEFGDAIYSEEAEEEEEEEDQGSLFFSLLRRDSAGSSSESVRRATEVLRPYCADERYDRFLEVAAKRCSRLAVGFERPSNPNNVWACLRTVDACGVQEVDLVLDSARAAEDRARGRGMQQAGARFSLRHSTMTTALGSQKWLSIEGHESTADMCDSLRARGFTVCATDLGPGALPFDDLFPPLTTAEEQGEAPRGAPTKKKYALIFGNEEVGISPGLRASADLRCYLPMRGFADSFNLSVAAASVLAHLAARGYLQPDLDQPDQDALVLAWLLRSVKAAKPILQRNGITLPAHKYLHP